MSPAEIAALRKLADAATPGPWAVEDERGEVVTRHWQGETPVVCGPPRARGWDLDPEDAAFIAAARTAVPALLDEVERLRTALRCLHATVRGYECESFGHDVLEAAMEDALRVLGEAGKDGGT